MQFWMQGKSYIKRIGNGCCSHTASSRIGDERAGICVLRKVRRLLQGQIASLMRLGLRQSIYSWRGVCARASYLKKLSTPARFRPPTCVIRGSKRY